MSRRDEDKKRRRQKRLEKHTRPRAAPSAADVRRLVEAASPAHWPGAADPSLAHPDVVKFELADFACGHPPGKAKLAQLEDRLARGPLGFLPGLRDWAMELFLWHGLPGDPWHPVDAYLAQAGDRFPPPARAQLRRWKEARLGLFEVGPVRDDLAELRAWDLVGATPTGPPLRAISLGIGGANFYRERAGNVVLTYLAPWAPAEGLFCSMGYGMLLPRHQAAMGAAILGLNHPDLVTRPLPWRANRMAADQYLRQWRTRDWRSWLAERITFPFPAVVTMPREVRVVEVRGLLPSTPEQVRQFGVYFEVPRGSEVIVAGGTTLTALDVTSPAAAALTEYHAYRQRAGPPPGTAGQPSVTRIR